MRNLVLAVLIGLMIPVIAAAGDVSISTDYGSERESKSFAYPADKDYAASSSGTHYKGWPASGLTVDVHDGRWGASAAVRHSSVQSTEDFDTQQGTTTTYPRRTQSTGSSASIDVFGQYYLTNWLHVDAGLQTTWVRESSQDRAVEVDELGAYEQMFVSTFNSSYVGPALGAGIRSNRGRANVRLDGAWYPWIHKTTAYGFSVDGIAEPTIHEGVGGSGFAINAALGMRVTDHLTINVTGRYRRLNDDGSKMFGDAPPIPQTRTFKGVSAGLSFRL